MKNEHLVLASTVIALMAIVGIFVADRAAPANPATSLQELYQEWDKLPTTDQMFGAHPPHCWNLELNDCNEHWDPDDFGFSETQTWIL